MDNRTKSLLLGGVSMLLSAFQGGSAHAEPAAKEAHEARLEEVVVTARRREESLQAAPVAATALNAQAMEQRSIKELKDFSSLAPNLNIKEAQRGGSIGIVTLRGQQNINQTIANDPAVGLYFDEVYLGRSAGILTASLLDMAQVQVLRGVQGTLFGRNNTGGAILFTPVRPNLEKFEGSVKLGYGSFNRFEGEAVFNAPIVQDKVGLRLAYSYLKQDGVAKSVTTGNDSYGDRNRQFGRATLRLQPVDDLTVDLTYDFTRMKETGTLGLSLSMPTPGLGFYESPTGYVDPHVVSRVNGYTLKAVYAPSEVAVAKLIVGRRLINFQGDRDVDGTAATFLDARSTGDQQQWSAEFNLSGKVGQRGGSSSPLFDYVAGAFYFKESGNEDSLLPWFSVPYGAGQTTYSFGRNKSFAVYAQGEAHLDDHLSIWAGARHTTDNRYLNSGTYFNGACGVVGLAPATSPSACLLQGTRDFKYWSWSVGARYQYQNMNAYIRASRGQRAGGLAPAVITVLPFNPEVVTEYEAGLKADWLDERLRTNLALFTSKYDQVQRVALLLAPNGAPYTNVFNAAKASVSGVEFETTFIATDHLRFDGAFGYIDAKYDKFIDPSPGPTHGADASGNKFPDTPKFAYNLSAEYRFDLANGPVITRVDWSWQARNQFAVFNAPEQSQPAYGLLNARITYRPTDVFGRTGVEFAVWGRNLADKKYSSTALAAGPFVTIFRTDQPRMVGVEAKASF